MADAIAKYYGTGLIEVLTGFKYIGQQILGFEQSGKGEYLFGFEESYGCLIGTHARDKDAIVASMALAEAAASIRHRVRLYGMRWSRCTSATVTIRMISSPSA